MKTDLTAFVETRMNWLGGGAFMYIYYAPDQHDFEFDIFIHSTLCYLI